MDAKPKPELIDVLNMLRTVSADVFSTEKFKEGLVRAFVKVGLAELENGVYANYTSHACVAMPSVLAPADSHWSSSRSPTSPSSTRQTCAALSTTRPTASLTLMTPMTPAPAARERGYAFKIRAKKGGTLILSAERNKKKNRGGT